MFIINSTIQNYLLNHVFAIIIFISLYSIAFYNDKTSFNGAKNYLDIIYFTTTTHSSAGYGDITANTPYTKIIVIFHQLIMILLSIQFLYVFVNI